MLIAKICSKIPKIKLFFVRWMNIWNIQNSKICLIILATEITKSPWIMIAWVEILLLFPFTEETMVNVWCRRKMQEYVLIKKISKKKYFISFWNFWHPKNLQVILGRHNFQQRAHVSFNFKWTTVIRSLLVNVSKELFYRFPEHQMWWWLFW